MEFSLKYHLNASLAITRVQIPSFFYLQESAIGFPTLMVQVRQLWVPAGQERGCGHSRLLQRQELQGALQQSLGLQHPWLRTDGGTRPAPAPAPGPLVGSRAEPSGQSCSASGPENRFAHGFPLLEKWPSAHGCGGEVLLEGRKMRAQGERLKHSLSLIALLFTLHLALQQEVGTH